MKKLIFSLFFVFVSISVNAQKIQYDVFSMGKVNLKTGMLVSNPVQYFKKILKEGNRFSISGDNYFDVYNERISHDGFIHTTTYDAVDKYKQRCAFIISKDDSAQEYLQWSITILYEGSNIGLMYMSNPPKNVR